MMPSSPNPATKVVVFQWPCGTKATRPADRRAPAEAGHFVGRRLVEEDEARRIHERFLDNAVEEPALDRYVSVSVLVGDRAFFLNLMCFNMR